MPSPKLNLKKFLTIDLFKELDLEGWPAEERDMLLESFGMTLQMRIIGRILDVLEGPQKKQLDTLLTEKPEDDVALADFLYKNISEFDSLVNEEIARLKMELMGQFETLKKKASA
jgi:hypothetical protein